MASKILDNGTLGVVAAVGAMRKRGSATTIEPKSPDERAGMYELVAKTQTRALWKKTYGKTFWMITDYEGNATLPYGQQDDYPTVFTTLTRAMKVWKALSSGGAVDVTNAEALRGLGFNGQGRGSRANKISSQDRSALIRLASSLPAGSSERKVILAGLSKTSAGEVNVPGQHIFQKARVYDKAKVFGDATVSGNAKVYDNATVYGTAQVSGNASVCGYAGASGNVKVDGTAAVYGKAWVSMNATVSGSAKVYEDAAVGGHAEVSGNAAVSGRASVAYNAKVSGNAKVYGKAVVGGNAMISGNAQIGGTAVILGGNWDGSEGPITSGKWSAPGVPA